MTLSLIYLLRGFDLTTSARWFFKCHYIAYATALLGLLEGPWHGLHRPSGNYVGPNGCSSTRMVTK